MTPRQALAAGLTLSGLGLVLGLVALSRRAADAVAPSASPDDEARVVVPVPSGWRRLPGGDVTSELGQAARSILSSYSSSPYGTLVPFTASDGGTYAGLIEQHYHPPGGAAKPWGYHTGVSLLVPT